MIVQVWLCGGPERRLRKSCLCDGPERRLRSLVYVVGLKGEVLFMWWA